MGLIWNAWFLTFLLKSIDEYDHKKAGIIYEIMDLADIDNFATFGPLFLINSAIILKEINLEFLQIYFDFLGEDRDLSIKITDFYDPKYDASS